MEVLVRAVGLNFRDVLNVLGAYPGDPGAPGADFAGEVVGIGEGVEGLRVGDRVFGIAMGALETYVTTMPELIRPMPSGLSFEAAASLPVLITTAHHALVECSGLRSGQRVLIHAGAGGVGLTAIHYAQQLGCEVIATAGSEAKREHLSKLGVKHIASSRDAEAFHASMQSYGPVDVVLNSLSEGFIRHSLEALREGGSFCEIGKRGIWSESEVAAVRPDVRYHVIAVDQMMTEEPGRFERLFSDAVAFGVPELPLTCFPLERAVEAFRYMQGAQHIGKVVLTQRPVFDEEGRYVISGGLGYLGRLIAKALIEHGARKIVLLSSSRSALPEDWDLEVRPVVVKCDVGELGDVQRVFSTFRDIKGVFHAAGVLSDGTLQGLSAADFERVYRPKVQGALNLDECARGHDIDVFMLFSSVASGFGSAGQANYAAANGCLDSLAERRVREGHAGLSVRWGAWSGGGMATDGVYERMARMGLLPLDASVGIDTMLRLIRHPPSSAVVTVCPLMAEKLPSSPYFSSIAAASLKARVALGRQW